MFVNFVIELVSALCQIHGLYNIISLVLVLVIKLRCYTLVSKLVGSHYGGGAGLGLVLGIGGASAGKILTTEDIFSVVPLL